MLLWVVAIAVVCVLVLGLIVWVRRVSPDVDELARPRDGRVSSGIIATAVSFLKGQRPGA